MGLPLHFEEPRDESAERFLRFNEGLGPRLKARAIYLSEVDQIDIRRQVFRVHDHLIDDSIRVRTASVSGRAVSWYVDFQIAHPLAQTFDADACQRGDLPCRMPISCETR